MRKSQIHSHNIRNSGIYYIYYIYIYIYIYSVVVLAEFAERNKVQRPNLWPYDYSFMRMSRYVAAYRLPNYKIEWWCCAKPNWRLLERPNGPGFWEGIQWVPSGKQCLPLGRLSPIWVSYYRMVARLPQRENNLESCSASFIKTRKTGLGLLIYPITLFSGMRQISKCV